MMVSAVSSQCDITHRPEVTGSAGVYSPLRRRATLRDKPMKGHGFLGKRYILMLPQTFMEFLGPQDNLVPIRRLLGKQGACIHGCVCLLHCFLGFLGQWLSL